MNHFSQQTLWWMNPTTPKSQPNQQMEDQEENTQPQLHHQQQEDDENQEQEMEHMFEKPLTPSDVGKLNRLVIPKQHAEKYLPLSRFDSVEKGLLLSFEDEVRKQWRFRYSYWNSSQSYVLTKGWSRFVKEKQLDAGDVVSFERRGAQLCIRWRRRAAPAAQDSRLVELVGGSGWNGGGVYYSTPAAIGGYPSHHQHGPLLYQPDCLHAAVQPEVQMPVVRSKKQVRLFGVDLDCQNDEPELPGPDVPSYSSQGRAHFLYSQGHDLNHTIQQDYNYSREYHQTRNYLGGSGDLPI